MVTQSPVIAVKNITKRFGGVVALDDVSLEFQRGEFHSVVGENGAGKSTLMKILSGVIADYEGEMIVADKTHRFKNTREAEENGISIIHQELNLVDELTAAANIFLGREKCSALGWLRDCEMEKDAAGLFGELGCDIDPGSSVRDLRVGNQQLVEIAKALSFHSEILIMDEPTSALTEVEVERLFAILKKLIDRGVTIIYISHKLDEVFRMSDRITVLRDGQLVKTTTTKETTEQELTHLMVGREIEAVQFQKERQTGKVLLEVKSLSLPWVGHARRWRLQDINFTLRQGEVLGIAGLMGAGRTELLECLFGIASATPEGEILLDGKPVLFSHPAEAMKQGIALVTEDRKRLGLFDHMLVRENVTICTLGESATAGVVSIKKDRHATEESIHELGIRCDGSEAMISSLSGGNQQKCVIARWLKTNPQVLLLDDPTRGIDVGAKAEIYKVIDDLCKQGMGIIFTSSELPELLTVCDRILVLCEGKLTREFAKTEFHEEAIMEAATDRG